MVLKTYDVIVVGAGHAGVEAALAAARKGCKTLVLTTNLDNIALMACNPSIGGPAKGHLVREIDALGGQMGLTTDATFLQMRLLNTGKGPAVQALRAQVDKKQYQAAMRKALEQEPLVDLKQAMVADLWVEADEIRGVITQTGITYAAKAVVLTTGTYLEGKTIMGEKSQSAGPSGQLPARGLSANLRRLGLKLGRFKTGTPPRLDGRTVNYRVMTPQYGDDEPRRFSFLSEPTPRPQLPCWLTHTTEVTHQIIRDNLHRAPMYSGLIEGRGPRYCPSIEDKIVRFADKLSHQVFLEPEGWNSYELYALGVSTSLPEEVQVDLLRSIPGLEEVEIMRPGYAIEYDYLIATQLKRSLEVRGVKGLFAGGQINGTSGYEEAAAQGLVAGANAAAYALGEAPLILGRADGYIGVLIDDLITKESFEPYRMMTSRAEFRLLLRMENADLRLTERGREHGLVKEGRWQRFVERRAAITEELERLAKTQVVPTPAIQAGLAAAGSSPLKQPVTAEALLRRPELNYANLVELGIGNPQLTTDVQTEVTTQVKYQGYVNKQLAQVERQQKLENRTLPTDLDYTALKGLSHEAQEKLAAIRPETVGQASRIAGVSPADISVLLVYLEQRRRHHEGVSS